MPNLNCTDVIVSLILASTRLFSAQAPDHRNKDHLHKNPKQKSCSQSFRQGYNKSYKKALKKYKYYNHTPVDYQPIRQPVVVATLWRAPRPAIVNPNYYQYSRSHINVDYDFSL
tara:strand:+ start:102 stop:443 length:342 start_codon:yes stop_codon:yes gene_type:complete